MAGADHSHYIDQILHAIDYGKLDHHETERRIRRIIDNETTQLAHPANVELLNACQTLLLQLRTHGTLTYESNLNEALMLFRTRIDRDKMRKTAFRRIVAAAAVIFMITTGLVGTFSLRWFSEGSSPDEQQYYVQGHEYRVEAVQRAIAEHYDARFFEFENRSQLISHLGFVPATPDTLGIDFHAKKYSVYYSPIDIELVITYDKEDERVIYTQFYFTDIEEAQLAFEQSAEGSVINCDGYTVYYTVNAGKAVFVWCDNEIVNYLSGEIDSDDGIQMINEIKEKNK